MKKFTHPIKRETRIRFANGSSFNKYWNYYRSVLNADNNLKFVKNTIKKPNIFSVEAEATSTVIALSEYTISIQNAQGFAFEFTFNNKLNGNFLSAIFFQKSRTYK